VKKNSCITANALRQSDSLTSMRCFIEVPYITGRPGRLLCHDHTILARAYAVRRVAEPGVRLGVTGHLVLQASSLPGLKVGEV
jgi:hypothetical protein